ncbi:MAG TPA: DNA repair protein RecN [Bacteroidota bacterium]|nr:DNA repair protein RecN [Bacteroidota bacterium]
MLNSLSIKNYALIDELAVEFGRGLNIITGETGAGKSIIIDALSLVLGERADTNAIRKGADKIIVEGIFATSDSKKLASLLKEHDIELLKELILRREISNKSQSRSFINDSPVSTSLMKKVGDLLVDLHGQHDHQSLLYIETHIDLLDDFGGLQGLVQEFSDAYEGGMALIHTIEELRGNEQQLKERRALYEFQMKEIDAVAPRSGEEEELTRELQILENAERLFSATERLYQTLYEGDNAVHAQLILVRNEFEDLSGIDKSFEEAKTESASASAIVDELAKFVQRYNSKVEFNPERLEAIRERLGQLSLLRKKYGGSLDTVLAHKEKISREIALAENFESEIAKVEKQLEHQRSLCTTIAQRLSAKRYDTAKKVGQAIERELSTLGISHPAFEVKINQRRAPDPQRSLVRYGKEWYEATAKGIDVVEFYISTNIGEDVKPLVKVASGGEISRIMLALKMVLAKSDRLPALIFDEIDVGISGRVAQVVGQSLKKLSQFHQLIAITHLPQIAGFADTHYVVEKVETGKRAATQMRQLDVEERISEVAKLMSGEEVTEAGLEGAKELMKFKS